MHELLDARFGGKQADFARAIKRSPSQLHQWLSGHRMIGDAGCRQIELSLGLPLGWMDGRRPGGPPGDLPSPSQAASDSTDYDSADSVIELLNLYAGCDAAGRKFIMSAARRQFDALVRTTQPEAASNDR